MPKTVRFLTECAGRNKGLVETVNDDTLAQAWVDAKLAEEIDRPAPAADPKVAAPQGPPVNRAVRRPPKRK